MAKRKPVKQSSRNKKTAEPSASKNGPVKRSTSGKMSVKAGVSKSAAPKKRASGSKKDSKERIAERELGTSGKSETMKAYERQKKLEDTMPLGSAIIQATSKLPSINVSYGRSDRRGLNKRINDIKKGYGKSIVRIAVSVAVIATVLGIAIFAISHIFKVESVTIEGNRHYSNEEICDMVLGDRFGQNSIYLSLKYKNKDIDDIPFIETMNVDIMSPSAIKITVYEKAVAGYVEYMGKYFYFDKDGTVIESSSTRTAGIPQVLGLDFDHIVLYDKLPVDSDEVFKQILEMTHLLEKYGIDMEKIYFDKDCNMTLYFSDARIKIGDFSYIDEKIIRLKDILPQLEGKKGVLRLDNYNGTDSIITFEVDS